jgi:hypothetical protein
MHNRWILLLAAFLAACGGGSAADYDRKARTALDAGDLPEAIRVADEGLARDAVRHDPAAAWRLEQTRLEALARSGKGADVKSELDRLATTYPTQVTASLYRSLADKAREAGDTAGAIDVLTAGDQRFPAEHASFVEAIEALKGAGVLDPAQVQRLKALGYL